jgi:membrane dipeptidase
LDRRTFVSTVLAATAAIGQKAHAQTAPVYIADMHFHSFFGDTPYHSRPMGKTLADGRATLVAWKIVGDGPWIAQLPPHKQTGEPGPGQALARLRQYAGWIKTHLAEQKLKLALKPQDVDLALAGEPHVVLSVEGSSFVENDPSRVKVAYDLGIRHMQLVHYIRNPIADFQTEAPTLGGLTDLGKAIIAECNRLGILVDLAHMTPQAVTASIAASKSPVVWSHGSVTAGPEPNWKMITWKARQLTVARAQEIAKSGGVVGLWAFKPDVGTDTADYGRRLLEMADWLGDAHVGFGTDINGLGTNATVKNFVDVRRVIEGWQTRKVPEKRIRLIASENYARVLKQAMRARSPA